MAEWLIAAVLKTADALRHPGVQIPLPPPDFCPSWSGTVQKALPGKGLGKSGCPAKTIKKHSHPSSLGVFQGL